MALEDNNKLMASPMRLKADTHVHFHDCFDEAQFLEAAADALCDAPANPGALNAALCLTESYGSNWFERLYSLDSDESLGDSPWVLRHTDEDNSVTVQGTSSRRLLIVAGRQIVCQEGLEVLGLGYRHMTPDGQPIRTQMQQVFDAGAIPVLPWGFGKWLGRRGRVVAALIDNPPCPFVLGDNGGRLAMFAEPELFVTGRERGLAILPGTDPFPFKWDSQRVGSYGIEWDCELNANQPFQSLRSLVFDRTSAGRTFGPLENLPAFFRNQIAIQLRRFARSSSP